MSEERGRRRKVEDRRKMKEGKAGGKRREKVERRVEGENGGGN